MTMEQVTDRIWTETKVRGCNPSFVKTSKGPVVIDTPQLPTRAVGMRDEVEAIGPIQYLINTEHHVDHIFGNFWFKGRTTIVHHQGVHERFMTVFPELDPFEYALEALPTDDPEGAALVPDRDAYYAAMGTADIVFTGDVTLEVGDRTFNLLHTPGHTPGQIAVYVPEERVVFTGDTIFSECTTWLMTSNVDQWIAALDRIRALDIEHVVPGHGPVQPKSYLATQRAFLLEWTSAVATAIAKGWSREETIARVNFADRYPVDIGQEYMMDYIQERNAGALWDRLTAPTSTTYPAKEPPAR
jgi:cyclase